MRHMVVLSASIALLTLSALLFGCSMHNAKTWQWNPFERPETAHRLPTVEMDFSPNAVPARTVPRSLPTPPAVASRGHDRRWSGGPNARPWKYIVIHHSATDSGSAALFHRQHLQRGWDELGYHFVIDNGHGGPDGRVEIGPRWRKQKHGAHCGGTPGNEYNEVGIGICLVGNFQNRMPTSRQMDALEELVAHLATTYDIPPDRIIAHRDAPGANTECCGRALYRHLNVALRPNLRGDAYARR